MIPLNVMSLFCEDIREESGGRVTLIGIMPDYIEGQVSADMPPNGVPIIPKLCIYTRLHFDAERDIGLVQSRLIFPNGETRDTNIFEPALLKRAREDAQAKGSPFAGVYSSITIPNFPLLAEGRLQVQIVIEGTVYLAGAIHMKTIRTHPSASEQLFSQSPSAPSQTT